MHQGTSFRLEQVTLRYAPGAAPALQDFDLGIEPGESVALVGPSGAGKTTVLNLLNGSLRPTSGRVLVDGRDIAERGPAELRRMRASIGFVHQGLSLVDNNRAISNVIAGRFGRRSFLGAARSLLWPNPAERREVHALLERVGIADKLYQRVDRLSGGQRQRVALARALYQQPGALLADEPVSAVDPARARHALELLLEVSHERGLSLCVSLHDLALARELFPRLVGVRDGRVLFDAPTAAVDEAMLAELFELEPAAVPI